MLREKLLAEINALDQIEPNVRMFVDQSSIFWIDESGNYVWMADHTGIDPYVDADHLIIDIPAGHGISTEGVGAQGVIWNNGDFESPYHVSDFIARINTINI